jgi:exopolyphosphatase/guanosine-5'-triphosphate,3'-diphosphate pyrophosphatase
MNNENHNTTRIAAIDIGTNSFHLVIIELQPDGKFKLLDKQREVMRLGISSGDNLNKISASETKKAIEILKAYKKLAEHYGATIRAVATSAVREAHNKDKFISAVKDKVGIDIEVVDGRTEAKMIFYGMSQAVDIKNKKVLCIDIGGGSSEFIYAENNNPIITESIKIGAVRLSKKFFPDFILNDEAIMTCHSYVNAQLSYVHSLLENKTFEQVVGASGTIVAAAILIQEKFRKPKTKSLNELNFTAKELDSIYKEILSLKYPSERKKILGMEEKRADIIPAGLIILKTIFDLFSIEKITISEYALREGIVIDTIRNFSNKKMELVNTNS